MGMFDWIKYTDNCPNCKSEITRWQSKDDWCMGVILQPWEVASFYAICPNCNMMVHASVVAEVEHVVKRCDVILSYIEE